MNKNKDVVVFTLVATIVLFIYSLLSAFSHSDFLHLSKVSILSDVFYDKQSKAKSLKNIPDTTISADVYTEEAPATDTAKMVRSFSKYLQPKLLTNFNIDTTKSALPRLMAKLHVIKKGKKAKVRIAWFGDSLVEADVISMQFRKLIQQFMGTYGVGFIPATSITSRFRVTAKHNWKGNWDEENFKTKDLRAPLYLSGHVFYTSDGEVAVEDETIVDTTQPIEKSLLCGQSKSGTVNLTVNGHAKQYRADKLLNRILIDNSPNRGVTVAVQDNKLPVYGITMEPASGIIIDNFSFRGISGSELGRFDTSFMQTLSTENGYDLVIIEYGVNLMFHAGDMDFSWYGTQLSHVLRRMQKAMPNTDFLVISTTDRAFFVNGRWQSAPGIHNLVKVQAEIAYKNGAAFYNIFENMGGDGTIAAWAETNPPLAKDDRIHPSYKGTQILGDMIFQSFMNDYNKANIK